MRASFFEVDVCSLARRESKRNPVEKGGRRGGRWACRRDRLHRFTRDSFAGAACAGPTAQIRPPATRAKTCARRPSRGRAARTTVIVAVKKGTSAPERRQTRRAARSTGERSTGARTRNEAAQRQRRTGRAAPITRYPVARTGGRLEATSRRDGVLRGHSRSRRTTRRVVWVDKVCRNPDGRSSH